MTIILEKGSEDFLEKNKFNIVNRTFINNHSKLKTVKLSFPWVMKAQSKSIIHKHKHNAVILKIKNLEQATNAYTKLSKLKGFQGTIIQEMIQGQELILGLKQTKDFGLTILLGAGGTDVEKTRDITFRVIPITKQDTKEMIEDLNIKITNKPIIIKILLKLNKLGIKNQDIQELDINPLIVNKSNATIVDARIVK